MNADPDFLTAEQDDRYEADLAADDLSQILADEDRDAIELRTALIDIASTRIGAFGVMV